MSIDKPDRRIRSRWGNPILDDWGYVDIPGWILRNYHKCGVSPLEMMFVAHVMSFKYDAAGNQPENAAKPALTTIAEYMGRAVTNIRRMRRSLEEKGLLEVTFVGGECSEYNFAGLTNRCLQFEIEAQKERDTIRGAGKIAPPAKNSRVDPAENSRSTRLKIAAENIEGIKNQNQEDLSATPDGVPAIDPEKIPSAIADQAQSLLPSKSEAPESPACDSSREGMPPITPVPPNPSFPAPTPKAKAPKAERKPVNRGKLFYAVARRFTDYAPETCETEKAVRWINSLRRVVLDAEGIQKPTAEQDAQIADALDSDFERWYKAEWKRRYNSEPGAGLRSERTVANWYGSFVQWRKGKAERDATASARTRAKPGCPHCDGSGFVRMAKIEGEYRELASTELAPVGVDTVYEPCACVYEAVSAA